ncbi:MAG: thiamine diphosphokinase [Blautia sp.]|nr:thiamine diphosphokinase [Blautia sp.]
MQLFDAVIVSGGNIDDEFVMEKLLRNRYNDEGKPAIPIAADRGLCFFMRKGLKPAIAIGDFDSMPEELFKEALRTMKPETGFIRLKPEKDVSDTHAALLECRQRGVRSCLLLGCTGTRLDHVMANLGLLAAAAKEGVKAVIEDPHNTIFLAENEETFRKSDYEGSYISFFPLGGTVSELTLTGFRYPLQGRDLSIYDASLTVSNEIIEEEARLSFRSGILAVMITRD